MKVIRYLIICLTCVTSGYSCTYISHINKESEVVTREITINQITHITADASCHIILSNETDSKITLDGQEHLLKDYRIENTDGALKIWHINNVIQKDKLVKITIPTSAVQYVVFNKPCEISTAEELNIDNLTLIMNGSSEFTESELFLNCNSLKLYCYGNINTGTHLLTGSTNELHLFLEGRIKVDALNFTSNKVYFTNKSSYDCYVNVTEQLHVKTYSTGDTFYNGDAEVTHEQIQVPYLNSTGKVIKLN